MTTPPKDIESQLDVLYEKLEHLISHPQKTNAATMSAKLDSNIQANLFSTRKTSKAGRRPALEKDISELKALVVKRERPSTAAKARNAGTFAEAQKPNRLSI